MTVYAKIENGQLITAYNGYNGITGLADSAELCLENGFLAYDEAEISGVFAGTHQIVNEEIIDITETPEYQAKILAEQNELRKAEIKAQINELDLKRIRAGFEPAIRNEPTGESTGETYLEHYTNQIIILREELSGL